MVFNLNYKGYTVEFWQDNNNHVHYVIWLEEELVKSGVFPDPSITIPEVKTLLRETIDAL